MMSYSEGVFFRLLNNNINLWQQELDFINSLSHLQHVELWLEDLNLTDKHINWLNQNLKKYTKIIHAAWVGVQPLSPNQPLRQAALTIINQTLVIAARINAQLITTHLGSFLSFQSIPKLIRHLEPTLKQIITYSPKPLVSIENMPHKDNFKRGLMTLTELEKFWPNFNSTNFTLDIGHCIRSREDLITAIHNHHSHIKNIHLHDATAEKDHQALGQGSLNLQKLLTTLNQVNYRGFLTLETISHQDTRTSWQILTGRSLKDNP